MENTKVRYSVDGSYYDIPSEIVEDFERDKPQARQVYRVGNDTYAIPLNERDGFMAQYPDAVNWSEPEQQQGVSAPEPQQKQGFWERLGQNLSQAESSPQGVSAAAQPVQPQPVEKKELPEDWENHSRQFDSDYDAFSKTINAKLAERTDVYKQRSIEREKGMGRFLSGIVNAGQAEGGAITPQAREEIAAGGDPEADQLRAAAQLFDNAKKVKDAAYKQKGILGGLADSADVATWDFGITDMKTAQQVHSLAQKIENNEDLTENDNLLLEALVQNAANNEYYSGQLSRGYKAGEVTGKSLPFMLEFIMNPLAGGEKAASGGAIKALEKRLAKKLAERAEKAVAEKAAKSVIKKGFEMAAKGAARGADDLLSAAGMAATTGGIRTMGDAYTRKTGDVQFHEDEDGGLVFDGFDNGEDKWWKAAAKAYGATTIEDFSEMFGNYFRPLGQAGKKFMYFANRKIGLEKVNSMIAGIGAKPWAKAGTEFLKRAEWNGPISEFGEELVGGVLNSIFVGDQSLDSTDPNGVFNKDNMIDTFLGVALFGGVVSAYKTAGYSRQAAHNARRKEEIISNGNQFFEGEEWRKILNQIDKADAETLEGIVKQDIGGQSQYTPDQQMAIGLYAAVRMNELGMERGEEKKAEYVAEGVEWGKTAATPEDINRLDIESQYATAKAEREAENDGEISGVSELDMNRANAVQRGRRDSVRGQIVEQTGQPFWRSAEEEGQTSQDVVDVITYADGREVYIISDDGAGTYATVDATGKKGFITEAQIEELAANNEAARGSVPLDEYLDVKIGEQNTQAEQQRMAQDAANNLAAIQQRVQEEGHINVGTPENEQMATVIDMLRDPAVGGVVVQVEGESQQRTLSWKEVATAYGMPLEPKSNQEIVNERLEAEEEAEKYNKGIKQGAGLIVPLGDEMVNYQFKNAEIIDGDVIIKAIDLISEQEVDLTPEMVSNLPELLYGNVASVPVADVQGNPVPEVTTASEPVPTFDDPIANSLGISSDYAYTTKRGEVVVDGSKLWAENPTLWAEWNDRNPNRVIPTKEYLEGKLKEIDNDVEIARKNLEAEAMGSQNPDTMEELQDSLNRKVARQREVGSLIAKYDAAEQTAAREAENAQREQEMAAAAAEQPAVQQSVAAEQPAAPQTANEIVSSAQDAVAGAKDINAKAQALQQMYDQLGARNTVVSTRENIVSQMREKGASEGSIAEVEDMLRQTAVTGERVEGFFDPSSGTIFMLADHLDTAEDANRVQAHEEKHLENRETGAALAGLRTGVSRNEMRDAMKRRKRTNVYDGYSSRALADEVLAVGAEIAEEEGVEAIPQRLRELGITNEEFINFVQNNIDYGRRNGQRRHLERRDSLQPEGTQVSSGQDGRNSQPQSGDLGRQGIGSAERGAEGTRSGEAEPGGQPAVEAVAEEEAPRFSSVEAEPALTEAQRKALAFVDGTPIEEEGGIRPSIQGFDKLDSEGIIVNDKAMLDEYGLSDLTLTKKDDVVTLNKIVVKDKGQGNGTRFMQDLINEADTKGWMLALTPDDSFGATSVGRLKSFYRHFGFKPNRGRNTDFTINESMVRKPLVEETKRLNDAGLAANNDEVRFSVRYAPAESEAEKIASDIAKETGVSLATARRWVRSEMSLAALILGEENAPYLDYTGDDRFTAIKSDSDYPQGTVDFNNICRKRLPFTYMYQRIQKAFPNTVITGEDLATIRQIMKDHGLTVACGLCYVEDRRQLLGEIAQGFIDELKGNFENYAQGTETKQKNAEKFRNLLGDDTKEDLSIYDLITLEGSTRLAQEHPGIYNAFQAFNAARGQNAGNLFQGYAEYKREILKWNQKKVKSVNANGGLRIFSYSDFEAHHLIDLIQIIQDCARKGVMIQGYTKVPAFARAIANTGIKLNRSLIPLGDTGIVDGKLAYDSVEGIDINDPDFLESNDNVGNILIGINDEQIRLAMADPFVHYIIPYHSNQSGLLRKMKQTGAWRNYKNEQTEKGENVGKHGVNVYTDVLAAAEKEGKPIKNEKQFVERFLRVCKEKGWTPRFARFLNTNEADEYVYTPGYYKLLLDFKLFDEKGRILPQKPVKAQFDDAFNAKILQDYVAGERTEGITDYDEIYDEIVEKLGLEDRGGVQFSVTAEEDAEYMQAVEAGDMEKAQEMVLEAARRAMPNTKVVDENGNPKVVYHQTNATQFRNKETGQIWDELSWEERDEWDERDDWDEYWVEEDFNTFSRVNARTTNEVDGFFFAPEYDENHEYGDRTIQAFLNIENPAGRDDYNVDATYNDAGRNERIRLQNEGYDGIINEEDGAVYEYIAFNPSQIKSAEAVTYDDNGDVIPLSERFNPDNDDIRFSIRGILGAAEDETAMANLDTAKDMEQAGKDAKTIWLATGWEKGADGKWRNEIPDAKPKTFPMGKRKLTVGDIIDAPELFASYPEVKDYKVTLKKMSGAGAFLPSKKEIELDSDYNVETTIPEEDRAAAKEYFDEHWNSDPTRPATLRKEMEKKFGVRQLDETGAGVVMHELQHAIQEIEGFAKGGSTAGRTQDVLSAAYKEKPNVVTFARAFTSKNSTDRLLRFGREKLVNYIDRNLADFDYNGDSEEARRRMTALRDHLAGLDAWGYRNLVYEASRLLRNAAAKGKELYNNLAGEVEARNVEKRMRMTEEERRNTPISETEDVAREEQGVRFSVTAEQDKEYMDAVNAGDMGKAQRMVDEAAKASGFDSPKLYHGSDAFGFTSIDTQNSDDGVSFWATNKESVAGSYTKLAVARRLGNEISPEDYDAAISRAEDTLDEKIWEFRNLIDNTFSEWYFGQQGNEEIRKSVMNANHETGEGDGVYDVLEDIVADAYSQYREEIEGEYEDFADWEDNSPEAQDIFVTITALEGLREQIWQLENGELSGGIYELYANTDNMFVVDAKGADWNNLHPAGLPKIEWGQYKDVPYKTRDVVKWAAENGYDGVVFKNIRDNGRYGTTDRSDVYAFTDPKRQVKYAAPVTYDDNGNVIPLSERFNPENDDIRFSVAYHGSGAEFDRFDLSHALEGEGAMAHGYGHYVALTPGTSIKYANIIGHERVEYAGPEPPSYYGAELAGTMRQNMQMGATFAEAKEDVLKALRSYQNEGTDVAKEIAYIENLKESDFNRTESHRYQYTVSIPDDTGDNYIDEMKTLKKDGRRRIAEVVRAIPEERLNRKDHGPNWLPDGVNTLANVIENRPFAGKEIRQRLVDAFGSEKFASEVMHNAGFVGIKYNGRSDGPSAVIFSDDDIKIDDRIRFSVSNRNQEVFVSNAERAVENIRQEKATPEQWLKMIEKNGGLKAGEDKWLGLSQWLKDSDKKTLTKQEILDFIEENKIKIEETSYGEEAEETYAKAIASYQKEYADLVKEGERKGEKNPFVYAYGEMGERYGDDFDYAFERNGETIAPQFDYYGEEFTDAAKYFLDRRREDNEVKEINATRLDYTTRGLDNKREIALTVPTIEPWNMGDSIHFGDAGEGRAVAWIRFGDAAKEGQRVLFIDEIQSKRHQEGREQGYATPMSAEEVKQREADYDAVADEMKAKYGSGVMGQAEYWDEVSAEDKARILEVRERYQETEKAKRGVRPAPFEKNWHELAMKRMLRLAAEEGYDYVAWTTGKQQAERYNMKSAIGKLYASRDGEKYYVEVFDPNGKEITFNGLIGDSRSTGTYTSEELENFFGKEAAKEIISAADALPSEDEVERLRKKASASGTKEDREAWRKASHAEIDGSELFKGEGMKGFYDEILPRFMNKYGKQWGVKVEDITLPGLENGDLTAHAVPVTQEMKDSVMEGQPMFSVAGQEQEDRARLIEEAEKSGLAGVIGEDGVSEIYREAYASIPKSELAKIVDRGLAEGGDIYAQLRIYMHELAKRGTENDETGLLFKLFDDIRFMASNPALTDADIRWMLFKETSSANEGDLLALAEERAMRNRWGVGLLPAQQLFQDAAEKAAEEATQKVEEAEQKVEEAKVATASEYVFSEAENSLINELRTLTKAMAEQKAYDKATVDGVVKFAKEVVKNGRISAMTAREVSRLLSLVNNATGKSPKFIARYVNQLMDMLLDNIVAQEEARFMKLANVKARKVNQSGVEAQGKLDIIGQAIIKAFRENMDSPVEDIRNRIEEVSDRISDKDDAIREEAQAIYSGLMLALQYKENIAENIEEYKDLDKEFKDVSVKLVDLIGKKAYDEFIRSSEEALRKNRMERIDMYRDLSQQLTDIIKGGVERAAAFREAEKKRVEDIHHDANRDMQGTPAREHLRDSRWQRFLNSDFVRFFGKSLATADQMFRLLGRKSVTGEGYLFRRYIDGWQAASGNASRGIFEATEILDKKAADVFDKPGMKWSDIYSIERKMKGMTVSFLDGDEMVDHELTQGNMLYIYMANKMQDGKMKLRRMGISEEDVEAIKKHLDPRFVELADWMQDEFYVNLRNKYNAVHERMFGAPMAAIDDYVPLKILSNARFQDVDLGTQTQSEMSSTITGSIIKRRKNSLALDILHTDAFSLAIEHIEKMEDWAAFAELRRDMNTLLSYKHFRNQIKNMNTVYGSGDTLWKNFSDVCSVLTGSYKPKVGKGDIDRIVLNVAKGVTGAKIAFRVNTAIKQLLSFPAYFSDARPDLLMKSIAKTVLSVFRKGNVGSSWKWCMENLPLFEKRWKSRIAGDTRLLDTDSDWAIWKDNFVKNASRLGMTPNAAVDALTVAIGAKAMYDTKKAQYLKDGYSEEKADEMAKRDAEILYNQTQQSSENAFVSPVQLDRTVMAVTLTTYRNSSMAYQRQLHDAIRSTARMMKPGYRARSIEFMKNQHMNNGLSEEQAQKAAERQYNRQWYRNLARVAIFGYGLQFLWKIGNDMWYLFFGDDDDEKNKILEDAALAELAAPVEGLVAGNVISDAWGKRAERKNNDKYGIKSQTMFSSGGLAELPLESDMSRINQQLDYDKPRAINGIIDLLVQSGVGVNPQTLTDAVVALIDYADGDLTDATNIALGVMRIAQIPQSTIERFLVDQIDMEDADKRKAETDEMAKQYAAYKVLKNAPLTKWMYNEGDLEKRLKSQEKAFKDAVNRRIALKEAISGEEVPETPEDFYKSFEKEMKSFQTDLNRAKKDNDTLTQRHLEAQPEYKQYVIWKNHQKGINKLKSSIEKTVDENLKKQWEQQRRDSIQTVMKELNENK